jgi:hypothetical protein
MLSSKSSFRSCMVPTPARIPSTSNAVSLMFVPHFPPTIVKSALRHFVSGKEYLLQSS